MDFARNERGFCVGFAWNLILFSFVREREGYKHQADCTVCHTDLYVYWGQRSRHTNSERSTKIY